MEDAGGSLHTAAMTVTPAPQPEPVNYSTETPAASEDTMIGNDLIVEIPWIVFGLLLAAVCLRLRRFRSASDRSRGRESQRPSDDGDESSANNSEPAGNDHHGAAVSSSTQPSQTRP
jgi:H+/gluconate symporter-like permease